MTRILIAALVLAAGLFGTASAAVVTLSGEATFGTNPAGISAGGFAVTLDTGAATQTDPGRFVLRDVSGTVTVDGTTVAFADAVTVAVQRANGRNVLVLRLGDVLGQANLRLTLIGEPGPEAPDFLTAVLAAAGVDTLRVQSDGLGGLDLNSDSFTATAAVPVPGAALLMLTGLAAAALRRRA